MEETLPKQKNRRKHLLLREWAVIFMACFSFIVLIVIAYLSDEHVDNQIKHYLETQNIDL